VVSKQLSAPHFLLTFVLCYVGFSDLDARAYRGAKYYDFFRNYYDFDVKITILRPANEDYDFLEIIRHVYLDENLNDRVF